MNTAATFRGITDAVDKCDCCFKAGLKRTVVLDFDGEVVYYGTTCAARALGMTNTAVTNAAVTAQTAADQAAELATELRTVYAAALAAFEARDDFNTDLARARRTYLSARPGEPRGIERYGMGLRAFCAHVAEHGTIPAPA